MSGLTEVQAPQRAGVKVCVTSGRDRLDSSPEDAAHTSQYVGAPRRCSACLLPGGRCSEPGLHQRIQRRLCGRQLHRIYSCWLELVRSFCVSHRRPFLECTGCSNRALFKAFVTVIAHRYHLKQIENTFKPPARRNAVLYTSWALCSLHISRSGCPLHTPYSEVLAGTWTFHICTVV